MKIIITGMQCSGKHEIAGYLEDFGVRRAERFSNARRYNNIDYMTRDTKPFTINDIIGIVDNNAYVYNIVTNESENTYVGLSTQDFDNADFVILTPQELIEIPELTLRDCLVVWVDASHETRSNAFVSERRTHSFDEEERRENRAMQSFVDLFFTLENRLYFSGDPAERIATILYTLVRHDDLIPVFTKTFD